MKNDYMRKAGLKACVVNVSGGVDSAVCCAPFPITNLFLGDLIFFFFFEGHLCIAAESQSKGRLSHREGSGHRTAHPLHRDHMEKGHRTQTGKFCVFVSILFMSYV